MIGVFDSGSGGLTVLSAIRALAPTADVIYFGDLQRAPYGNRSAEEISMFTADAVRILRDAGATDIVSACNSVSVTVARSLFQSLGVTSAQLVEMVQPTSAQFKDTGAYVLVLATRATIRSGAYAHALSAHGVRSHGHALPDLVGLIEAGSDASVLYASIRSSLESFSGEDFTHVLLGCTHFPLIAHVFTQVLRDLSLQASLVDPASAVAEEVVSKFDTTGTGSVRFLVSAPSERFAELAAQVVPTPHITVATL